MKRFGIIDIGTLKVKCLVADVDSSGTITVLHWSNKLTCFGLDIRKNDGRVLEKHLQETITELQQCRDVFESHGVQQSRVISTHVMRLLRDPVAVLERVKKETGFDVEVISQQKEAELFFRAALKDFSERETTYIVADMGSGSTQILIGTPDAEPEIHLFETGAQYLHEHFTHDPHNPNSRTTREDLERMREHIREAITDLPTGIGAPFVYGSSIIIDMMQAFHIPLFSYPASRSHPYYTKPKHLSDFITRVIPLTYTEREQQFHFHEGYIWGVDKAFTNVLTLCEHLGSDVIVPTNANISQGLLYEMMS